MTTQNWPTFLDTNPLDQLDFSGMKQKRCIIDIIRHYYLPNHNIIDLVIIFIIVTIFGMAGMNLGTNVSAATCSASKFRAGNNVITLQEDIKQKDSLNCNKILSSILRLQQFQKQQILSNDIIIFKQWGFWMLSEDYFKQLQRFNEI
ncbi:Hypothetical_protein [Hexamita inflata]|uniref:Hypothetical_protein n=1 Tax=Hexamita inflata TaxID=28002 RepID=A0AA86PPB4_9EUKA|nr:Hypothetical protein HINF_LOCUS29891 [Hexamita inflata]